MRKYLRQLDKIANEPQELLDYSQVGRIVSNAARQAATLGHGQWARYVDPELEISPETARRLLAEMIGATADTTEPAEYLTIQQAADYIGYSVSGLRKLVKRGEVRFAQSKPSAPLKFRREWLDAIGQRAPKLEPQRLPTKASHGFDAGLLG